MKKIRFIPLLLAVLAPPARAENSGTAQMRDASTHEQLVLTYRKASQADPMRGMQPATGPDPSTAAPKRSLLGDSDVICFNGAMVLVPKRAVLQIPKNKADRLKYQPGAKILSWSQFYALNRGWITTVEVSRVQAEGNEHLKEEVSDRINKSANLVVAIYQGTPISVLPPKEPVENEAAKEITQP